MSALVLSAALVLPLVTALSHPTCTSAATLDPAVDTAHEQLISDAAKETHKVVLILAPFLRWEDITATDTPNLWQAAATGAIGDVNARSRVKEDDGRPSLAEGALAISAGAWPITNESAYPALQRGERFGTNPVEESYRRVLSGDMDGYEIAYLGLPRTIQVNATNSFKVVPGTLGSAIEDAGGVTAAIGNSDLGYSTEAQRLLRPAAIAAMNEQGFVRYGQITEDILEKDTTSPFGVRTDRDAFNKAMKQVAEQLPDDNTTPALVVLDPGDGYRARTSATEVAADVALRTWHESLDTLDTIYGRACEIFDDATIIVASQASRSWTLNREGFGPLFITTPAATGDDTADRSDVQTPVGLVSSDSTHRRGLVTNVDLTATILTSMEVTVPVQVLGAQVYTEPDPSDIGNYLQGTGYGAGDSYGDQAAASRIDLLEKMNNTAISVEVLRPVVINVCVWTAVVVLAAGAVVITFADKRWSAFTTRGIKAVLYVLILGILCIPAASWLMFLIYRWPATPTQANIQFLIVQVVLWAAALLLWRLRRRFPGAADARTAHTRAIRLPVILLSGVTTLTIVIDQLLGAPASFTSFFGYSPIAAFRFYGIGNEGAAVLFGAVIVCMMLMIDQWPDAAWTRHLRLWGVPIIGLGTVFVSAAPGLGANVGVAAWATVGFAVLWLLVNRWKINFWTIAAMFVAVCVVVFALILLDRYGTGAQTHLARSLDSATSGGLIELWQIVVRKAGINLRVFTQSSLTWVFAAVIAFLIYMRARPTGDFARVIAQNPYFGYGIAGTLTGGVVSYFTEDSGIVLPALMVLYMGAALVWLMLQPVRGKDA
ncbi:MAG: hypothetical protein LBS17_02865 [Actinomycetes bacterium]|jgi:hypothetical protein|nr:hypothetical protein [Actinomycetes bacterium]